MLGRLTLIGEGLRADGMARHGSMMAFFGLAGGFFAYLYQLSMGIMLTPVQYGMLFSLTSLFAIIMIASQAIQTKVAYALLSAMLIEIGLIIFFHSSIAQIVDIMLISGALCLTFILPLYLRVRRREAGGGIYDR